MNDLHSDLLITEEYSLSLVLPYAHIPDMDLLYDLQGKAKEVLRSYLVYILEQRTADPSVCDIDELRSCVQILTNKGVMNPAVTPVHFTPKYGNTIDLVLRLPSKPLAYKLTLVCCQPSSRPFTLPSYVVQNRPG